MTKAVGAWIRLACAVSVMAGSASCGKLTRQGQASSYLIINSLEAASGATPSAFGATLSSDVRTVVNNVSTFFADPGQVQFALGLKDPGSATLPTSPTQANWITVDRYHVAYIRSDGHNVEGVDVPYAFDGAVTVTVSGPTTVGFVLVRNQAKQEAPLQTLTNNGLLISTLAQVTFYGHDQTGREVSTMGQIGVTFGNFGD
jgi:hypothetical protein